MFTRSTRPAPARDGVLFISHDAWRTGAPMILLHLLRWLKANTTMRFAVLLREGIGDLQAEFEKLGPVFAWNELPPTDILTRPAKRGLGFFERRDTRSATAATIPTSRDGFGDYMREAGLGLIYSNTITNGEILAALKGTGCPVVTHVHELGYWISHRMDPGNVEQNRRYTTQFIAVSHAVRENLVANVGIAPERIEVIHEFIPVLQERREDEARRIREQLGIPLDSMVVGGAGTTDWRKAPELFVQLAAIVKRRRPESTVHFVWVGGEHEGPAFQALWHDVVRGGVADRVHFVGVRPNPLDYFSMIDLFAMVSREDPFPLVALEAAALGRPVLAFDGSGGTRELVEDDAGVVVPYLDIETMAAAVHELSDDPARRARLGARAAQKVRERHEVGVTAPRVLAILQRLLGPASLPTR